MNQFLSKQAQIEINNVGRGIYFNLKKYKSWRGERATSEFVLLLFRALSDCLASSRSEVPLIATEPTKNLFIFLSPILNFLFTTAKKAVQIDSGLICTLQFSKEENESDEAVDKSSRNFQDIKRKNA